MAPDTIHHHLSRIAADRARSEAEEAHWIALGVHAAAHRDRGYPCFADYLGALFGYEPRAARERVRVALALEALPQLAAELGAGRLPWSVVRELSRVATPATQARWLEAAAGRTAREVEALVAGREPGALPDDPVDEPARRHRLRFEVSGATLGALREARRVLTERVGEHLDDDAFVRALAQAVLQGSEAQGDAGRAPYQVQLTVCEGCGRGAQLAAGEPVALEPAAVEQARCDATETAHVGRATQTIAPRVRRAVMARDGRRCVVPGCCNAVFLEVHHLQRRVDGGGHDLDNLGLLCGAHHAAVHEGRLRIEGRPSTGLRFFDSAGRPYGPAGLRQAAAPERADEPLRCTTADVLRRMGFTAVEAKRKAQGASGDRLEDMIRSALQVAETIAPYGLS